MFREHTTEEILEMIEEASKESNLKDCSSSL